MGERREEKRGMGEGETGGGKDRKGRGRKEKEGKEGEKKGKEEGREEQRRGRKEGRRGGGRKGEQGTETSAGTLSSRGHFGGLQAGSCLYPPWLPSPKPAAHLENTKDNYL